MTPIITTNIHFLNIIMAENSSPAAVGGKEATIRVLSVLPS